MTSTPPPGRKLQASESPQTYVAEILRHEAEVVGPTAAPVRRLRLGFLVMLVGFTVAVTMWNLVISARPPVVFTPAQVEASARFRIYLLTQDIEAFRDSAGILSAGLEVLGHEQDGITYVTRSSDYQLLAPVGADQIRYHSGDDLAPFASAYELLAPRMENDDSSRVDLRRADDRDRGRFWSISPCRSSATCCVGRRRRG